MEDRQFIQIDSMGNRISQQKRGTQMAARSTYSTVGTITERICIIIIIIDERAIVDVREIY